MRYIWSELISESPLFDRGDFFNDKCQSSNDKRMTKSKGQRNDEFQILKEVMRARRPRYLMEAGSDMGDF